MEKEESVKRRLWKFLLLLGMSVSCALLFVFALVYYYGNEGRYVVSNILLSPQVLKSISHHERNSFSGENSKFVFDKIEVLYVDTEEGRWRKRELPLDTYQSLYTWIQGEQSILEPPQEARADFSSKNLLSVELKVRAKSSADFAKAFQEVQFAQGSDFFRVELHKDQMSGEWLYFYLPKAYEKALKIVGERR